MYRASENRYKNMPYRRCGKSGLMLPAISLGLWHNFGNVDIFSQFREIIFSAFDQGITHFDLANNYGPPPGSAEENFGMILKDDLRRYRDEMVISTKAGYGMWPGPYGDWGSRKYLISSLDQSLKRMNLDYVDIFYSHRPDPNTPIEETMTALDHIVRQGKALYVGLSNYSAEQTKEASKVLRELGTPCLIHQPKYSMFERWSENGLLDVLEEDGIGAIAFSPLAQGLLTNKYLKGIPDGSRAAKAHGFLQKDTITEEVINKVKALNDIAEERGQSLAQMAISWLLKDDRVTSVLVGASSVKQLSQNIESVNCLDFGKDELAKIENILK
ncbi:L-glyceraldehyde 3-phosphate reductase [Labilibaculum sp. DW002]|uniref:L-glyceraldehyde 3-phosphate reductase n=1 Tax=Paralabilibaculum antarcticum TaxID=2912572 RepID=A0ABT5VMC9_9BACT|nr:L-glyceraldehyde 3-phosphate reductase [Labilibaculum sp. DW002]MDE5416415.1 L-glyceraldehyde 3-phosphate reductase [Labilibaculum sp. DW002]